MAWWDKLLGMISFGPAGVTVALPPEVTTVLDELAAVAGGLANVPRSRMDREALLREALETQLWLLRAHGTALTLPVSAGSELWLRLVRIDTATADVRVVSSRGPLVIGNELGTASTRLRSVGGA